MIWLEEHLGPVVAFLGICLGLAASAIVGMGRWVWTISAKVEAQGAKIVLLETAAKETPGELKSLRTIIESWRDESRRAREDLFVRVEEVRKELDGKMSDVRDELKNDIAAEERRRREALEDARRGGSPPRGRH